MPPWILTGLDGKVEGHPSFDIISHASSFESACSILKNNHIRSFPERKMGIALVDKPIEVVWFSPNDWQYYNGNNYGCISFDFNWTLLVEEYGLNIYFLEEIKNRIPTSRILLSNSNNEHYFGKPYDPAQAGGPWGLHEQRHYIRRDCVLQIAVDSKFVSLHELKGIRFIDQKNGLGSGKRLPRDAVARFFLARAVGEYFPAISGFSGLDKSTERPSITLLESWYQLSDTIMRSCPELNGTISSDSPEMYTIGRAFLDRYSRPEAITHRTRTLTDDAKNIQSLFSSKEQFELSLKKTVAQWASIPDPSLLDREKVK